MKRRAVLFILAAMTQLALAEDISQAPPTSAPATNSISLVWIDSLDAGYLQSQRTGKPIVVFIGDENVPACREQWEMLQSPAVANVIGQWTLVRLTPEGSKAAVRSLGVLMVPAIRLLGSDGTMIGERNGPSHADQLTAWLLAQGEKYGKSPAANDSINAADANEAVRRLGDSDAVVREAAIRQLRNDPSVAGPVIDVLSSGSLAQRLSAVDLLGEWGAAVSEIDPWQPATITADRLASLRAWARSKSSTPTTAASTRPAIDFSAAEEELDALVGAPVELQARAVRERLVRFGDPLLPLVYDRLAKNPPDPARQRLVALRYRLVATDRLAAEWPGGFDRLASSDSVIRRAAMGEISLHAQAEDHRLLSELFADNDPFLREQSLQLLRSLGGPDTGAALVGLLHDPDLNVRAAVLKTLTDSPDPSLARELVRYVDGEADTDLIVHAVHALEKTPGAETFECLLRLLTHKQWRVRGEAAEAMLGKLSDPDGNNVTSTEKAAGYAALDKCLDDEDGYVANRAVFTLIKLGVSSSADALVKAAQRRPDLAEDVLHALTNEPEVGKTMLVPIRTMAKSPQPIVRAAAVAAIATLAPQTCGSVVKASLDDPDVSVRAAGFRSVVIVLDQLLPRDGTITHSGFLGFGEKVEHVEMADWVESFRKGERRPGWLSEIAPRLEQALTDPKNRLQAAVALCAMGREKSAYPILFDAARQKSNLADIAKALVWLPSDRRIELVRALIPSARGQDESLILVELTLIPDDHAANLIWDMLGSQAADADLEPAYGALRKLYLGDQYYNMESLPDERKLAAITAAKKKISGGTDLQRAAALTLLLNVVPNSAANTARDIYKDPHTSDSLRIDALQVLLMATPADDATPIAIEALNDKPMRKTAISYLAAGTNGIRMLRGSVYLYTQVSFASESYGGEGAPVVITPPAGLTAPPLRAALEQAIKDGDSDFGGYAGYLLVLIGDHDGLPSLLKAARSHDLENSWARFVYRAIAKANDDSQTPVLEQIYRGYKERNQWEIRELYWTIRPMTGPNILKLRKTIRDEIGMNKLR